MTKHMKQESIESKIVWGIGRFFRNLFGSSSVKRHEKVDCQFVTEQWQEIENKIKLSGESNFHSAVLSADKLLEYCLEKLGARGETMGERLKNSEKLFHDRDSYQAAWDAHKQRNYLVHDHNYDFLHPQAKSTIDNYKKALIGLGVI